MNVLSPNPDEVPGFLPVRPGHRLIHEQEPALLILGEYHMRHDINDLE